MPDAIVLLKHDHAAVEQLFTQVEQLGPTAPKTKGASPQRPHPKALETPPGNLTAGPAAAVADGLRAVAMTPLRRVTGRG